MNTGGNRYIAFFCGSDAGAIGGMETHARYFCEYFQNIGLLRCIVTMETVWDCVKEKVFTYSSYDEMIKIIKEFNVQILFFNDGHWIEDYISIRTDNPNAVMIMRSGGNEFVKAAISDMSLGIDDRRRIWTNAINSLDYIISNSSYSTHRMLNIGIMKEKIVMVRGGVDVKKCCEYSSIKSTLRKKLIEKYKIDSEACVLGIVSRFEKFKGIEQTIDILSKIRNVKWHLVIAGSGSEENNIIQKLKNRLEPEQYTMVGQLNIDESLRLIASIDYLLNMSLEYVRKSGRDDYIHTETMGRSMIEAICCKTPIIATNVGGVSELFLEQRQIGFILEDSSSYENEIENIIQKKVDVLSNEIEKYDWFYIFEKIYRELMNVEKKYAHKANLVIDIEGSIIHDFCGQDINKRNFERILRLSDICNLIINTAGELDNIFKNYPYVNDYVNKIIIIANCGKKVLLYGNKFIFWENYHDSLRGPNEKLIDYIKCYIESKGYNVKKISEVDKLYINYKVIGISEDIIEEINVELKDTPYAVCKNSNNLKLISEEIEKGNTLRFICSHILKTNRSIGVGNGVLDLSFMELCHKSFLVNHSINDERYIGVSICSSLDMQKFIEVLENAVKKESTCCDS